MTSSLQEPFPRFVDRAGQPLTGGFVYVGVANANPVTNPIAVFFDADCTVSAEQPLTVSGGFIIDGNGAPANIYVAGVTDFSVEVRNRFNVLQYAIASYPVRILSSAITFDSVIVGTSMVPDAAGGAFNGSMALPWSSTVTRAFLAKSAVVYNQSQPSFPVDLAALNQRKSVVLDVEQTSSTATPSWINNFNCNTAGSSRISAGVYEVAASVALPSNYSPQPCLIDCPTTGFTIFVDGRTANSFRVKIADGAGAPADNPFTVVVNGNPALADPIS